METFADYILNEEKLISKMEIVYYLSKRTKIYFDKSVVIKTELAKLFIDYMKLDVDRNLVLTACLLCNCKKVNDPQKIGKLHTYALDGARYLKELGFNSRFCKICEEVNRYSESNPREKESDILELVDNFGGMILPRPERIGFESEEALVLMEYRNLKEKYNRYLEIFKEFVQKSEELKIEGTRNLSPIRLLVKACNESKNVKELMNKICYEYSEKIEKTINRQNKELAKNMFNSEENLKNPNRPLFAEETTKKILERLNNIGLSETNE